MKFRIECRDTTTVVRETWIEAETLEAAVAEAEKQDWREWSEVDSGSDSRLVSAEDGDGSTYDLPL